LSTTTSFSGGTTTYTCQWLQQAPGAGSYSNLGSSFTAGCTTSGNPTTSTGVLGTAGTWHFELQVTDSGGAVVTSNTVTVSVTTPKGLDASCVASGSPGSGGGTSFTLTLPSCQANDIIIVVITQDSSHSRSFTISDAGSQNDLPSSAWTLRGSVFSSNDGIYEYWATNNVALSGDTITISTTGNAHNYVAEAMGIMGASTTSPFDTNGGLPYTNSGGSGSSAPSVTGVSTSNSNDIILAFEGDQTGTHTAGTGFTLINSYDPHGQVNSQEYEVVGSTLTSASVTFGSSVPNWVMMVDAVDPPTGGPSSAPSNSGPPMTASHPAQSLSSSQPTGAAFLIIPLLTYSFTNNEGARHSNHQSVSIRQGPKSYLGNRIAAFDLVRPNGGQRA
jgi:hypothetical protein